MAARRRTARGGRSQHFLRRGALASSLVREPDFATTELVLEVGAGAGALTAPLLHRFERVCAIEVDPAQCERLRRRFAGNPRVEIVQCSFFDVALPSGPYAAVGNLPFHRTSDVLVRLTDAPNPPHDVLAIVEDRAAARYAGRPYGPEGLRSIWLKPSWHVEVTQHLSPREFEPVPRVGAAVLWMARRERPLVSPASEPAFRDFTATGFAGPDVGRALRRVFTPTQLRRLARDFAFGVDAPPSSLCFEQWLSVFRAFLRIVPEARQREIRGARGRLPRRNRYSVT